VNIPELFQTVLPYVAGGFFTVMLIGLIGMLVTAKDK
tara:strand:- start:543 stop:653 length:111 start_codon:yes stop_codon:yes gene_type:complete